MNGINFRVRPAIVLTIGLMLGALVEFADYLAGPQVILSPFHLIVVAFFTWFLGRRAGIVASILAAISSVVTDHLTGASYTAGIYVWNACARFALFIFGTLLLNRLQAELKRQKEDNEKLHRANEEIQKLSKIKDDFTAMVSHELRTPLVAIRESMRALLSMAWPVPFRTNKRNISGLA